MTSHRNSKTIATEQLLFLLDHALVGGDLHSLLGNSRATLSAD